jgi:hypothetical protein
MKATQVIQKQLVLLFWDRECIRLVRMGQKNKLRSHDE